MPCACKVKQDLSYLHKKYGKDFPVNKHSHFRMSFSIFLKKLMLYALMLIFLPVTILFILFQKNKITDIAKLFRLR